MARTVRFDKMSKEDGLYVSPNNGGARYVRSHPRRGKVAAYLFPQSRKILVNS